MHHSSALFISCTKFKVHVAINYSPKDGGSIFVSNILITTVETDICQLFCLLHLQSQENILFTLSSRRVAVEVRLAIYHLLRFPRDVLGVVGFPPPPNGSRIILWKCMFSGILRRKKIVSICFYLYPYAYNPTQ